MFVFMHVFVFYSLVENMYIIIPILQFIFFYTAVRALYCNFKSYVYRYNVIILNFINKGAFLK